MYFTFVNSFIRIPAGRALRARSHGEFMFTCVVVNGKFVFARMRLRMGNFFSIAVGCE